MITMPKTKVPKVAIFAKENLPIICPSCSHSLGVIDAHNLDERHERHAWAIALSPIEIARDEDPAITTIAFLVRGECPACGTELAAPLIQFSRKSATGASWVPKPPRLSLVLHGGAYSGWAMIQFRDADGDDCIEHLFEPVRAARIEKSVDYVREFLLDDLPRPEAGD